MKFITYLLLYLSLTNSALALDAIAINENYLLFSAFHQTTPIVTAKYVSWNSGWKWAGASVKSKVALQDGHYLGSDFTGKVDELGISFSGSAKIERNQIVWRYQWDKKQSHPGAQGFGIEFNLNLASPSFNTVAQDPQLLPGNQGWQWTTPSGNALTISFDPPLKSVYFERNQKNKIRALFFSAIEQGTQTSEMTVKFSPAVKITEPLLLRYGGNDKAQWHSNILPLDISPINLSFLNDGPAGQHGFVTSKADQLFFADGTPAKFWGANLMAGALFSTSDSNIKLHAKRIAQLGFNLIRIHHHDSRWVKPNIFKNPTDNTLDLSENSLRKLDWWIKCLKDEGVYVWLDLHVGRVFTKNDRVDSFDDLAKAQNSAEVKGFNYYNDSIQQRMQSFNQAYLSHLNSFTGLAYKDDPAVIALLLTNENDLTHHFGNALLPNKGVPVHSQLFSRDVQQFAQANNLPANKIGLTWVFGESKIYLNDAEHRFHQKMIAHLKDLGFHSLISAATTWGGMSLASLPSLTDGDIIDVHAYGDAVEELNKNPRYNPGFLSWIGAAQISAKPLSVSEWNIEPPARDRFTAPIFTASLASLQGWDAIILYGYSQVPLNDFNRTIFNDFSTYNDPAIMGLMPAAALLYRQNHVAQAKDSYSLTLDREQFYFNPYNPTTSKTIRTLLETSRLTVAMPTTKELPWLQENIRNAGQDSRHLITVTDANRDFIPTGQNFVASDTGELLRDWNKGLHTINTAKSQIASGWIGGERITLNSVTFDIATPKAVVSVQSLQNEPITNSSKIFITAMAQSELTSGNNMLPFYSEPVIGKLYITAPKDLTLFPITSTGTEGNPIPTKYNNGQYEIILTDTLNAHWLKLMAIDKPKK